MAGARRRDRTMQQQSSVLLVASDGGRPLRIWQRPPVRSGPPGRVHARAAPQPLLRAVADRRAAAGRARRARVFPSARVRRPRACRNRATVAATSTPATRRRSRASSRRRASSSVARCWRSRKSWAARSRRAFIPIGGLHHASRAHAAGFCVFNDCGVAIELLRGRHGVKRVAYVDIDAHHGDGVFYAFESRPGRAVRGHPRGWPLPLSRARALPRKPASGAALGTKLNLPLPPGRDRRGFPARVAPDRGLPAARAAGIHPAAVWRGQPRRGSASRTSRFPRRRTRSGGLGVPDRR